jgi:hypothetical protein
VPIQARRAELLLAQLTERSLQIAPIELAADERANDLGAKERD